MSKQKPLFVPRGEYKSFILSTILTTLKMLLVLALIAAFAGGGVIMGIAKAWVDTAPEIDLDIFDSQAQTSFIYDKYGELITTFRGTENRVYATYDELPKNLINAVIAVEDARFWQHSGVDVKRYIGALVGNLLSGNNQGGSTITCQLIKQTMLSTEQTYRRKVQEAYLALELEDTLTGLFAGDWMAAKERILLEYMNVVYMGGSIYGTYTDPGNSEAYGRHYTWAAAMDSAGIYSDNSKGCGNDVTRCSPTYPVQGICPVGWHLPSGDEWRKLYSAMGSSPYAMQAKGVANWRDATDAYGFSAIPADGYGYGNFYDVGFWSATESSYDDAYFWRLDGSTARLSSNRKYYGYSVRCVKD